MSVTTLNKDNFKQEVNESKIPVIVDFWASWCGPCQKIGPIFEDLSEEYEGKLIFAKVNTEEESELASENQIRSIPCLIIFKEGKEADRIIGLMSKEELKQKIDSIL